MRTDPPHRWLPIATLPPHLKKNNARFLGGWRHRVYGWLWDYAHWHADAHHYNGGYFVMGNGGDPSHWLKLPPPPRKRKP